MTVPARLLVVAVLAFVAMAVAANGALMRRAHIEPGCTIASGANGAALEECHRGWFKGYPSLAGRGCTAVGMNARLQFWSCPKP